MGYLVMKASDKLNKISKGLDDVFEKEVKKGTLDAIIENIIKLITVRTRLGKGVEKFGGQANKLDALTSKPYIARRKKFKSDLASGITTPKKSNATATGQMLDSMQGERKGLRFTFSFKGNRKGELGGYRSRISNSEVARWYGKKRSFFTLSKTERQNVIRQISEIMNKRIKKVFNRLQ